MSTPARVPIALPLLSAILLGPSAHAQLDDSIDVKSQLFVATADLTSGGLLDVRGGPPWSTSSLADTTGGRSLRVFGKFIYVVDAANDSILRVSQDGESKTLYPLAAGSEPQDILVFKEELAIVTRRNHTRLLLLDLTSGQTAEAVDLGVLAAPDEQANLGTMQRDGKRLLVQVQLRPAPSAVPVPSQDGGVLAVVSLATGALIDVDPNTPGPQGVALQGAPPRLRMQTVKRTLFVSTTDARLDNRGGIEMVDLDALQSIGYALDESQFGADLGGFVMTSEKGGYFVFHTDIVQSTHLKPFTIEGGVPPGPEMVVLLGDFVDSLGHDPKTKRIFLPSGTPGFGTVPGIYAFSTVTNQAVAGTPVYTGLDPHDLIVVN